MGKKPSVALVDKIIEISGIYKGEKRKYNGLEDIFPKISRYNRNLEQVEYVQLLRSSSNVLFDTMKTLIRKHGTEISCVVTAPPESFFLHMKFDHSIIMFDIHPRPHLGLKNSHFLIFDNAIICDAYLKTELLKSVKLDVNDISEYQLQAMNAFEANIFCLKKGAAPNGTPNLAQLRKELFLVDNRVSKQSNHENRKSGKHQNCNISKISHTISIDTDKAKCKDVGSLKLNIGDRVEIAEDPTDKDYRRCEIKNMKYDDRDQDFVLEIEYLDDSEFTEVALKEVAVRRY